MTDPAIVRKAIEEFEAARNRSTFDSAGDDLNLRHVAGWSNLPAYCRELLARVEELEKNIGELEKLAVGYPNYGPKREVPPWLHD